MSPHCLSLLTLVIYEADDINRCHFNVNNMKLAEIDLLTDKRFSLKNVNPLNAIKMYLKCHMLKFSAALVVG